MHYLARARCDDSGRSPGIAQLLLLSLFLMASLLLFRAAPAFAGTVCGQVRDASTGLPVAGAGIFVREPAGLYAGALAVSGVDGSWCIGNLTPGTYTLEFRVDDYLTAYVNGVIVTDGTSDVPVALAAAALRFDPPWPNPASGDVKLRLQVARAAPVDLRIYDTRGRLVRAWQADSVDAGAHEYTWDGRDGHGRAAPAGVYLIRARSGDAQTTRPLIVTR
jgi:hypothetical protein